LVNEREATLSSAWDIMRDDYSRLAARALPRLLQFLPDTPHTARAGRAVDLLRGWDYRHVPSAAAAPLFQEWWRRFHESIWLDELRGDTTAYMMPSRSMTLSLLLSDSLAAPFDDVRTPERETAGRLARL